MASLSQAFLPDNPLAASDPSSRIPSVTLDPSMYLNNSNEQERRQGILKMDDPWRVPQTSLPDGARVVVAVSFEPEPLS